MVLYVPVRSSYAVLDLYSISLDCFWTAPMLRCALQMRNVLRAENGGKVKAVHAKMGSSVSADEVLVEFE